MINFFWLILALGLILLNAFFVSAEFGMVRLRSTRIQEIKENYRLRGAILEKIHAHLDAYLSACQVGITLASLGLGWIGEPAVAYFLRPIFILFGVTSLELIKATSFIAAFSILSFLHNVVGELMPKSIAIRQSEAVSVWTSIPLYVFYWMMYPAIWILNACSNLFLKIAKLDVIHRGENFYSTEEIQRVLHASYIHGELTKEETEILEHTLEFADLRVTEVMRPKEEMVTLNIQEPIHVILQIALELRYSRYPIYDPGKKEIIGIVHVKDLFAALYTKKKIDDLSHYIRPILKVSHRLPAIDLLRKFREGMPHFALVYMGKENLLGFVTLDNLLHILIGRIQDEFHKTIDDWVKQDGSLLVKGKCSIYSLERALGCDITLASGEEDLDTVSGLILARLGYLPKPGEKVGFAEFDAIIEEVKGTYVQKIEIKPRADFLERGEDSF